MPPCLGAHTCPPPQGGCCKSFCPPFPDAETQALRSEMTRPLGGRFTRAVGSLIEPTGLGPWHVNPKRHAPGGPRMAHGLNIRAHRGTCKGAGLSGRAFPEWRVSECPLRARKPREFGMGAGRVVLSDSWGSNLCSSPKSEPASHFSLCMYTGLLFFDNLMLSPFLRRALEKEHGFRAQRPCLVCHLLAKQLISHLYDSVS